MQEIDNDDWKVGFTASAFDLLHAGHVMMLEEASRNCDYLICGLHVDPSLQRPEKNKPIQSLLERYIQLEAVKYVGEIIPYETESDLRQILQWINPSVRFIGEEYKGNLFTGHDLDIPIHYNSRLHSYSSSELRERLEKANV